jgi:sensor histidine kinase YesM
MAQLLHPKIFERLIRSRFIVDLVFLVASYFVLISIFSGSSEWQVIDHLYTSIFLTTLMVSVTINDWIIRPKFLNTGKHGIFLLLTTGNILIAAFFNHLLFDQLIDYIFPGFYFISYYDYVDLVKFFFVFVALTTLIQLAWEWFQLQETRHRLVMTEKERINAELKALTNQVNPHFLFNSLTVLYSLALKNAAETPSAIIKLSDILRYVIYESAGGAVPLRSEIDLIHNYLELQRYRVEDAVKISFFREVEDENVPVESMLFLPLIENSFKHGVKADVGNTFIDINLKSMQGHVTFRITNNKSPGGPTGNTSGGIGLRNIQDRLKLMYAGRHRFNIFETEETFTVEMKLPTP